MTKGKIEFGASVICMDHINFERDVNLAEEIGVDYLHLDIMDGRAVPRYGLYPEIVKRLCDVTNLPMDLHLMVDDVEFALKQFKNCPNIKNVTFHIDNNIGNVIFYADLIREMGMRPGVVMNLSTPFSFIEGLLYENEIDLLMFMGIHPGVLEPSARPQSTIQKITKLINLCDTGDLSKFTIQIDGAVTLNTLTPMKNAGATSFVGGTSTIYKNVDRKNHTWEMQEYIIRSNMKAIKYALE